MNLNNSCVLDFGHCGGGGGGGGWSHGPGSLTAVKFPYSLVPRPSKKEGVESGEYTSSHYGIAHLRFHK